MERIGGRGRGTRMTLKLIIVGLSLTIELANAMSSSTESSAEYLRKVMTELQELNVPARSSYDDLGVTYRTPYQPASYQLRSDVIATTTKLDLDPLISETVSRYHQIQAAGGNVVPRPAKLPEPSALGFTRAELAAMYKSALERGAPVSLSALTNGLESGKVPRVAGTHLELSLDQQAQPPYKYYYYPLKTFANELHNLQGFKVVPAAAVIQEAPSTESQKQIANPLFVAISTFIGMAVLFMIGVLFLPKLGYFGIFKARSAEDDLHYVTRAVVNAMDRYESINQRRSDVVRSFNASTMKFGRRRKTRLKSLNVNL